MKPSEREKTLDLLNTLISDPILRQIRARDIQNLFDHLNQSEKKEECTATVELGGKTSHPDFCCQPSEKKEGVKVDSADYTEEQLFKENVKTIDRIMVCQPSEPKREEEGANRKHVGFGPHKGTPENCHVCLEYETKDCIHHTFDEPCPYCKRGACAGEHISP